MKWIICTGCDRGVPPEYLQTHLWDNHKINCSNETMNSIIATHDLITLDALRAWKKNTITLEVSIAGIDVDKGHKCIECGHCTPIWGSMLEHFRTQHEGIEAKEWTKGDIQMQSPFGGELKKWFEIINSSAMEVDEENESAWEAVKVLLACKRQRAQASTGSVENVRWLNGFIARIRWDILIEGQDKKQLRALGGIVKEKNPLYKVMEVSENYFTEISNKLRNGDILLRRKIESEG